MNAVTKAGTNQVSLITKMALERNVDPDTFYKAIKAVIMPPNATTEQTLAFLLVADRYGLDPMLKEIHCFLDKRTSNIVPMISVDGWAKMMNNHPAFDGVEFDFHKGAEDDVEAITCRIFRKDRSRPIVITEYLAECFREGSEPWKKTPTRMLRHRALIQCIRIAFGFSGAFSEDDQPEDAVRHDITLRAEPEQQPVQQVASPAKPLGQQRPPSRRVQENQRDNQDQQRDREQQQANNQGNGDGDRKVTDFDPETGEVIDGDLFDPEQALKDLDGAYAGATSHAELDDTYNTWGQTLAQLSGEGHIRRARNLYDQHHRRISASG